MEIWCQIPHYEGYYEVSNKGRVRSLPRIVKRGKGTLRVSGKIISTWRTPPGNYQTVALCKNGVYEKVRVHRLVLLAFAGPCPSGMVACHNNGIIDDLRIENLRWDTKSANAIDCVKHGGNYQSNKTHCIRGHEFTSKNTYINPSSGGRQCRQCLTMPRKKLAAGTIE